MLRCFKKKLSKKEAVSFINYIQKNKGMVDDKRKECRYYHCPLCNHWHTTQLEQGETRTVTETELIFADKWNQLIEK